MLFLLFLALLLPARAQVPVLHVWHAYRGEERHALDALLRRWDDAHPDLRVDVLAVPYGGFASKLEAAAPRGNGPDLFVAAHERLGAWSEAGLLAPAPDFDTSPFHPATVDALRYRGELWGVPLAYKCLALFSNRALVPEPPKTTDDLVALARHLPPKVYALAWSATEPYFEAPWIHAFGGGVFDGANRVALDRPENARALGFAHSLLQRGIAPQDATTALVTQLFNEGRAATVINGPWFLGEIDPQVDFQVSPVPAVSGVGPARPYLTVDTAFVSAYAKLPEEAWALARWLASPEAAIRRAVDGRQAVATLAAYDDPRVGRDPVLGAFRVQLDQTVPMPDLPAMASVWEPLARAVRRVMRGAYAPSDALKAAQQEYEIVSRPPPPAANPWPYAGLFGVLGVGGLGLGYRRLPRVLPEMRRWRFAYGWVAPAALGMLLLVVVPFVVGAAVSLFAHHDGKFTFVGLANFLDILLARDWPITSALSFWFTLVVTVLWTTVNVALHVSIGVALAMLLREPWLRLRAVYRVLLILPWAVPNYITALIWKGMFNRQFGAINGLLHLLGLPPVGWFERFSTAFTANVVTNTWLGFPFMMVVTLGALQAIPRELEQAAEVDGASGWQRFRHVTLPLLKPALLPAVILGSVWTFNMFNIIYLVSGGEPDGATEILISDAYRWAFTRGHRYGYAAAYSVLIFFVLMGWSRATRRLRES